MMRHSWRALRAGVRQRAVARKVLKRRADYVLALKGNQGTLRDDVEVFVTEQKANGFRDTTVSCNTTVEGDYGRIRTRDVTVFHNPAWLGARHDWPGPNAVVMVESRREIDDRDSKTERETRFNITSLTLPANQIGAMVCDHWAGENSLRLQSWTWSSATTNAACEPTTRPPISSPSNTSPST